DGLLRGMARAGQLAVGPDRLRLRGRRRDLLRLLSRPEGGRAQPHRSLEVRVNRRRGFVLGLLLVGMAALLEAQTFTPQSSSGLSLSHTAEKVGGSRVLIFGEVRNTTNSTAERVAILAEGLDEGGHVVSRGRSFVTGSVPSRGSAPLA